MSDIPITPQEMEEYPGTMLPPPRFDVPGIEFYDIPSKLTMKYVYPDTLHWSAGWILYKNPGDGGWVTLRKATETDLRAITGAVVRAHHE